MSQEAEVDSIEIASSSPIYHQLLEVAINTIKRERIINSLQIIVCVILTQWNVHFVQK